jgi:hypothetical protein
MPRFEKNPQWKRGSDDTGERRLAWFNALNREAMQRSDCWLISTPSGSEVLIEALPESSWPAELRQRGFPLVDAEPGQRILPHAIKTEMALSSSGALMPATPGSTKPTSFVIYGAGPTPTRRFEFPAPFKV